MSIMKIFLSKDDNLVMIMKLLLDDISNVQYEAFKIFSNFVQNPRKTNSISTILRKNKSNLLKFLKEFQNDRTLSKIFI
jgi:hypothetical protein